MNNLKREWMIIYMCRNGIATFAITLCAFLLELTHYYQSTLGYAMQRIFTNNMYTLMYFLSIWILNYVIFEIFEIGIDTCKVVYKDKIPMIKQIDRINKVVCKDKIPMIKHMDLIHVVSIVIPLVLAIIIYMLVPNLLFKTNFCLLLIFMTLRSCKEFYKKIKADSKESTSITL